LVELSERRGMMLQRISLQPNFERTTTTMFRDAASHRVK